MNWFKMDMNVRNDPKIRALRAVHGAAGLGNFLALVSYVGTEGSQTDPGVGLDATGLALDLTVMAYDLGLPTANALRDFLTFLATVRLIHPGDWAAGIVTLPAMRKRAELYRQSKGRTRTGRPVGRPRNPGARIIPVPAISTISDGSRDVEAGNSVGNLETGIVEIVEIVPEKNPGEIPGNSGELLGNSSNLSLLSISVRTDQDLLGERSTKIMDLVLEPDDATPEADPRLGKLTVRKLVRLWNLTRTPGPKVLGVVPARYERFRLAIRATPDAATWETAIGYLNGVAWANAPGGDGNTHANFRADLDYLAKPGNVTKALERLAAAALPKARPARHTGRIMDSPERRAESKAARRKRDAAEDEELKAMGL